MKINVDKKSGLSGFTLIELMFTLSIGAILITVAVPSYTSFTKNNQVTTQTNELVADINLTRSIAVTRGQRVIICRSANPTASSPVCGGSTNTWNTGWLIFASGDGNTTYDSGADTLIKIGIAAKSSITIKSNSVMNAYLMYKADGSTSSATPASTSIIAVCDDRGISHGNQIQIKPTGRPRLVSPVPSSCTSPTA